MDFGNGTPQTGVLRVRRPRSSLFDRKISPSFSEKELDDATQIVSKGSPRSISPEDLGIGSPDLMETEIIGRKKITKVENRDQLSFPVSLFNKTNVKTCFNSWKYV